MFDALTTKFGAFFDRLRGRGRITEANIGEVMQDVRTALLEADVNVEVVEKFVRDVTAMALGAEVMKTLHPEQLMVKIVHDELVRLMGPVDSRLPFVSDPPTIVLMAGLQGSGKTTTCGKLALYCRARGKKPLLVAADLKRPAAIDQLEVLGQQLDVPVYVERDHQNPVRVCRNGVERARRLLCDVVILDTAGRLAIDEELMQEVANVAKAVQPHQIYLVIDAMTGQDAVHTAKSFNERLELDGVILTKFDSDTRGGAVLSVKHVTGKPIKFIGVGEKLDRLEEFHPDRIAGRILGMGDVVSLVEKAQQAHSAADAAALQARMAKGQITLDDFIQHIDAARKMGPLKELMKMIPGVSKLMGESDLQFDESEIVRMKAIVQSMTPKERRNPDIIDGSRRRRIARGSGADTEDVSAVVKQFGPIRDMMKATASMGMFERMRFVSKYSEAALSGGRIGRIKGSTFKKDHRSSRDKRRDRKRRSR